jgi:hypothetical protein
MWNWFNCYLSGRHDFGIWCEPGAIFLRCVHCGKRSNGIAIESKLPTRSSSASATVVTATKAKARVVPFGRVAAR